MSESERYLRKRMMTNKVLEVIVWCVLIGTLLAVAIFG